MKMPNPNLFLLLFLSFFLLSHTAFGQVMEKSPKKKKISLLDRLQMDGETAMEIQTNIQAVFEDWRVQNYHWGFAKLELKEGETIAAEIQIKARGKYRSRFCENPPLKIKFDKKDLRSWNLKKWNEFKVVYPCKSDEEYQIYVLKEFLTYKLYNELTENSFRVQLIDLTLKDSTETIETQKVKGFLIEDREELVKRLNAKKTDVGCKLPHELAPLQYSLFQVFQFAIGNTDWLPPACKNVEIILLEDGQLVPIPFDFDFSGMVAAGYSSPSAEFGISSVKERYFLGHQKSLAELEPVFKLFKEKKNDLIQVIDDFEHLPKKERREMIRYLRSFYQILALSKEEQRTVFSRPMVGVGNGASSY